MYRSASFRFIITFTELSTVVLLSLYICYLYLNKLIKTLKKKKKEFVILFMHKIEIELSQFLFQNNLLTIIFSYSISYSSN